MTSISAAMSTVISVSCALPSACGGKIYSESKKIVQWMLSRSIYAGYKKLDPTLAAERRNALFTEYNASELQCSNHESVQLDAVYIPSPSSARTGNVLVICLNTTYQDHNPSHWKPFLDNGADIVVWNPSKLGPIAYSNDLSAILRTLRARDSDQVIAVKTYCASVDSGIKAISEQNDEKMHILIDRGHGDVKKLARSFTLFSKLPIVQTVLREEYDCKGVEKIHQVQGRILFLYPKQVDQVMDYGKKRNFTRELHDLRSDQPHVELKSSGHWSRWGHKTYNKVLSFLADIRIVREDFEPATETQFSTPKAPTCFQEKCIPLLTKSWC